MRKLSFIESLALALRDIAEATGMSDVRYDWMNTGR